MSKRAKEIAEKIIGDVWPNTRSGSWLHSELEAAVERNMLRPHQVRDRDGVVWNLASNGKYSQNYCECGFTLAGLEKHYGPLTEVQGEPLPDVAAMKAQIAETEEVCNAIAVTASDEAERQAARIAELENMNHNLKQEIVAKCDSLYCQRERIAELKKQLAKANAAGMKKVIPEKLWWCESCNSECFELLGTCRACGSPCRENTKDNGDQMKPLKLQLEKANREVYECLHLANCETGPIAATLYGLLVNAKNALETAEAYVKHECKNGNRTSGMDSHGAIG